MDGKIYVVPASGATVVDPETNKTLPPEGDYVTDGPYWRRRINDKDASEGTPPSTTRKKG